MTLKYASVCDGIGAVHVAWQPLGWHCEWTAEIDAFPAAVVEQRWGFPNRGDMTQFKEWNDGSIDLLVGGTPCQSFSVAGLRKGLHDPRGGLMLTFLEIAQRYRPRWVVWENVPGVLSSNGGRDFGAFLGALGELGYGWAYRVLDAQWFGVAQRRRRVFVVGCLGDERRAAQVLFESESVRRDNPPSRAKGQGVAAATSSGVGVGCKGTTCSIGFNWQNGGGYGNANDGLAITEEGVGPLSRSQIPAVSQATTFDWQAGGGGSDTSFRGKSRSYIVDKPGCSRALTSCKTLAVAVDLQNVAVGCDTAGTLDTTRPSRGGWQAVCAPIDLRQASRGDKDTNNRTTGSGGPPGHGVGDQGAPAFTVSERGQAVAFDTYNQSVGDVTQTLRDTNGTFGDALPAVAITCGNGDTAGTLRSNTRNNSDPRTEAAMHVMHGMAVRRLTPRECERLQGFPDDYTAIEYRKKPAADGPRYKALGNSMAVPVMAWIGQRIAALATEERMPA